MMRLFFAATLAALLPLTAFGREVIGPITATVDGTETTLYVTTEGSESQSFAMKTIGIPAYQFSVWGNPEADSQASLKGALVLTFAAVADARPVMNTALQYFEDGYSGFWVAQDDQITIELTRFDVVDNAVSVEGQFEAEAQFSDDAQTLQTDPSRTKALSGGFEATLQVK